MMRIPVVLKDGTEQTVDTLDLQQMLTEQVVMFFKRRNGWVVVGRDNIRGAGGMHSGEDRRQVVGPNDPSRH